jgi:uncharacterized membrane protein YkvA (DUF1232 family)
MSAERSADGNVIQRLRRWAADLNHLLRRFYCAMRHPATPGYVTALLAVLIAYAVSPIDLIPDVIPVIGLLDDLILLPAGFWLCLRLIPRQAWAECENPGPIDVPRTYKIWGLVMTILIWAALATWLLLSYSHLIG